MRYRPLPRTVEMWTGESIASLFIRTANANGMSPQELAREGLGMGQLAWPAIIYQPRLLDPISAMFNVSYDLLDQAQIKRRDHNTVTFNGEVLGIDMVDFLRCRLAPSRTKGPKAFLRHHWSVRLIDCDPTTGELLVDRCTCGRALLWATMTSFGKCSICRLPWHELPSKLAAEQNRRQARFWAGLLSAQPEVRNRARRQLAQGFTGSSVWEIWRAVVNGRLPKKSGA